MIKMKTMNLKSIYLAKSELKQAIIQYLALTGQEELAKHLTKNVCEIKWSQDGKGFIVGVNGEFEDDDESIDDCSVTPYGEQK